MKKIVLTGGGTAGHVIPNLALIPYLDGNEIHYIGSGGMEKKLTGRTGVIYHEIPCVKLVRKLSFSTFAVPFKLMKCVSEAKKVLREIKPDVIFSKGGYVSLPVSLAKPKKVPLILHESDCTPGLQTGFRAESATSCLLRSTAKKQKSRRYRPLRYGANCTAATNMRRARMAVFGEKKSFAGFRRIAWRPKHMRGGAGKRRRFMQKVRRYFSYGSG